MPSENKKKFKALILAGGYATRLYPITLDISKPLLKIDDTRTIIDFCIQELTKIKGLSKIIVITNDKFYRDYVRWKSKLRIKRRITIVNDGTRTEKSRLGAIGDIYYTVKKRKINSDILVIGGDNIFDKGLLNFMNFAKEKTPNVSIGIYNVRRRSIARRYGVVKINRNHRVLEFKEKPRRAQSANIAMCLYYFPKETLGFLKEYVKKSKFDTDKTGNYIKWLLTKCRVYSFRFGGLWLDIGQIDTYSRAQQYFSQKKRF